MSDDVSIVTRQHDTTTLKELEGNVCEKFVGVFARDTDNYIIFYMVLDGVSHRFFLDAGILFWTSHEDDSDDDLFDGDKSIDLGFRNGVLGEKVDYISIDECVLTLRFRNGKEIEFTNTVRGCGATLIPRFEP